MIARYAALTTYVLDDSDVLAGRNEIQDTMGGKSTRNREEQSLEKTHAPRNENRFNTTANLHGQTLLRTTHTTMRSQMNEKHGFI